jgi:P27 family predicted phage terminase small subunit
MPATRGPKRRTSTNTKPSQGGDLWSGFAPPIDFAGEALAEYTRLVGVLDRVGTLRKTDPRIVVAAARTHALIERATAELAGDTLTLQAANGTAMPHPMLAVLNTLTMRLTRLWSDMGLTPASARLTSPKSDEKAANPWDGLLNATA